MTISTVTLASPPVSQPAADNKPSVTSTTGSNDNATTWQPPAKPPLPPGQGTRIDQLA